MNRPREQLIDSLAAGLTPVTKPGQTTPTIVMWLCGAALLSVVAVLLIGPLREHAFAPLLVNPRYLAEAVLGTCSIVALAIAGLRLAVPSMAPLRTRVTAPLLLLALWVGLYAYGLHDSTLPVSMAGKRAHCMFEAALIGVPALAWGLWLARRWWPLHGAWSGLLLGFAAGAMPALLMQFACMYAPPHILLFHLLPGLSLGVIGALAGAWYLRQR